MLVADLTALAEVAALAKLDLSPKPLTLRLEGDQLHAIYQGTYIRGELTVPYNDPYRLVACTVGSSQFIAVTQMLGANEVVILGSGTRSAITFESGGTLVTLNTLSEEALEPASRDIAVLFEAERSVLRAEIDLATDFCAKTTAVPLFTGVRLAAGSGDQVAIVAFDGYSGLLMSRVPAQTYGKFDTTIPGYDLITGSRVIHTNRIRVGWRNLESGAQRFTMCSTDGTGLFDCTPLQGNWPDLRPLLTVVERHSVVVPADRLRTAVDSVKLLGTDNTITLAGTARGVSLRTSDSEHGRFDTVIPGTLPDGVQSVFDVAHLRLASQLGGELALAISTDHTKPTLVQSGDRRYWIARRVR